MNKIISATELKTHAADILNEVYFRGNVIVVERYGKPIAEIVPPKTEKRSERKNFDKVLNKYFGAIPDFPDVTKFRRSRKKKFSL